MYPTRRKVDLHSRNGAAFEKRRAGGEYFSCPIEDSDNDMGADTLELELICGDRKMTVTVETPPTEYVAFKAWLDRTKQDAGTMVTALFLDQHATALQQALNDLTE